MSLVESLADAIERFEGGRPGDLNTRNNNPGNLRSWGDYPVVDGYVQFPDYETGRAALLKQIGLNISRGLSLDEFFGGRPGVYGGYAPAADSNSPSHYAATVAGWLGVPSDVPLADLAADVPAGVDAGAVDLAGELATAAADVPDWALQAAVGVGLVALAWLLVRAVGRE